MLCHHPYHGMPCMYHRKDHHLFDVLVESSVLAAHCTTSPNPNPNPNPSDNGSHNCNRPFDGSRPCLRPSWNRRTTRGHNRATDVIDPRSSFPFAEPTVSRLLSLPNIDGPSPVSSFPKHRRTVGVQLCALGSMLDWHSAC